MSEEFKAPRFVKLGAVFENTHDKEGNEYLDENGNPRPSYVLNLGNVKYRLFPNQSDNPSAPMFDVSFDIRANTYKKKE